MQEMPECPDPMAMGDADRLPMCAAVAAVWLAAGFPSAAAYCLLADLLAGPAAAMAVAAAVELFTLLVGAMCTAAGRADDRAALVVAV